jgi:hypothetical protein
MDRFHLGKVAYEAYCTQSGGVSLISSARLPVWEMLKPEIQTAWAAAAAAVVDAPKLAKVTLSGKPADPRFDNTGAPGPINPITGMHTDYWVLSPEERAKGFVRPIRDTYKHVGRRPKHPLRDLTPEEHESYDRFGYVKYETYPEGDSLAGCFWTEETLRSGCQGTTTMAHALAETYARDPKFYGATFCATCQKHYPVEEFHWEGSVEQVGS